MLVTKCNLASSHYAIPYKSVIRVLVHKQTSPHRALSFHHHRGPGPGTQARPRLITRAVFISLSRTPQPLVQTQFFIKSLVEPWPWYTSLASLSSCSHIIGSSLAVSSTMVSTPPVLSSNGRFYNHPILSSLCSALLLGKRCLRSVQVFFHPHQKSTEVPATRVLVQAALISETMVWMAGRVTRMAPARATTAASTPRGSHVQQGNPI